MRKNVFTRSIKILIITLLLLAVLFQKEHSQKLMALAIILWIVVTAGMFLLQKTGKPARKRSTRPTRPIRIRRTASTTPWTARPRIWIWFIQPFKTGSSDVT